MNQADLVQLAKELSDANGASGFEDAVVEVLRHRTAGLGEAAEDKMRNFYVRRPGGEPSLPTVMLDAHTDEVSFMIRAIHPNGTLKFTTLGGWVSYNLPAHAVRVRNADGKWLPGIITSKPPHFMTEEEKKRVPAVAEMAIDIGASSAQEAAERYHIRIGEPAVPDVVTDYDPETDTLIGKAFDCRLGCAALVETLDLIRQDELAVNVTGAFAVQEEMGTRGATVTARKVAPDLAIVFEGCPADDTFGESWLMQTKIGKGPYLRYLDAKMITHPRFQRFALDLAEEKGIPVQAGVRTGGATDGAPIHLSAEGVPVIVIGIPVRYIHTHYGIAKLADVENAARLAAEILRRADRDLIDRL